jgi:hypothetical protein
MDGLAKFEIELDKPRTKWNKAEWRMVALKLAGVKHIETRGRKTKSAKQVDDSKQNLLAAEFWRNQNIEATSVPDGDVGTVQKRHRRFTKREATEAVLKEAIARTGAELRADKFFKKTDALVRDIQVMQKNRREK